MPRPPLALRFAALLSIAAIALHEARHLIGFGDHAGEVLAARGHAYLPLAGVLAVMLLGLAMAHLLVLVGRARRTGAAEVGTPGPLGSWLVASAALLAVYAGQELLEGAFAGQLSAAHLVADDGLAALPLALALGGLVALFMRGADAAVQTAARAGRAVRPARPAPVAAPMPPDRAPRPRRSLIALRLAGRAPPSPA